MLSSNRNAARSSRGTPVTHLKCARFTQHSATIARATVTCNSADISRCHGACGADRCMQEDPLQRLWRYREPVVPDRSVVSTNSRSSNQSFVDPQSPGTTPSCTHACLTPSPVKCKAHLWVALFSTAHIRSTRRNPQLETRHKKAVVSLELTGGHSQWWCVWFCGRPAT